MLIARHLAMALLVAASFLTAPACCPAQPVPVAPAAAPPHFTAATAYAVPLENIKIDGSLDDWPKDMVHYPLLINYDAMGPTKLDDVDLADNPDCCAYFMVGYSVTENTLYVAIVVRDDKHVVGNHWDQTDAVEVYVMGDKGKIANPNGGPVTAMQFSGVAGNGTYAEDGANFSILWGNAQATASKFGYSRKGDITTYEFALKPFDDFSMGNQGPYQHSTQLTPGKRVGFDVGVVDKDVPEIPISMIAWATIGAEKYFDPALLGDVELLPDAHDLVPLEGNVTRADDAKPYARLDLEAWKDQTPCGVTRTDAHGHYRFMLPAAHYTLRPAPSCGAAPAQAFAANAAPAKGGHADLTVAPITLPPALARAAKKYATLRTYRDTTTVRITGEMVDGSEVSHDIPIDFAFERPNRFRISSTSPFLHNLVVTSDGKKIAGTRDGGAPIAPPMDVPPVLTFLALNLATGGIAFDSTPSVPMPCVATQASNGAIPIGGLVGSLFPHRLLLRGDPLRDILDHADRIEDAGPAVMDGQQVRVIEITKPAPWVLNGFPYWGTRRGQPAVIRLSIGEHDDLIHQFSFEYDMAQSIDRAPSVTPNGQVKSQLLTWTSKHKSIHVDEPIAPDSGVFGVPPEPLPNTGKTP